MSREAKFGYGFLFLGAGLPYLIDKLMGPIPALIAAAILFVVGIAFLVAAHLDHKTASVRRGLMYTIGAFTIIGAASGALIGSIAGAIAHTKAPREAVTTESGAIQLSLTCDTVNLPLPYRGDLWFLETIFLKGLAKLSANPLNPDGLWPEKDVSGTGFRCVLKNHGTTPAFGVTIPIEAAKRELIRGKDGSWRSGDVIEKYSPIVSIPQPLGQQGQDPFTFYICSYDPDKFIEITLPTFAFVNGDDISNKTKITLRVTATLGNPLPIMPTTRTSR
jgi:hypothetical protein